ncbi:pre-peptidase C-terminal domain-containing protein, partial [Microcoleus sp. S13_B4]|uniref:pre-peptidase C-terminal domain-containing protein n=1 Tax=Microcoleus sp. S13_B4 TaxID=3055408 RepID=UPI002FD3CC30
MTAKGILDTERHLLQMDSEDPANNIFDNPPLIGNISPNPIVIKGFVSNTDPVDWYKFTVPPNNQQKINVTVSGLTDKAELSFFSSGDIPNDFGYARGDAGSDASVTIPENLQPGDYRVRVLWSKEFGSTPYTLTLKGDSNATPSLSTIAFSDANYTVNENGTKATITFKRNGPIGRDMRGIVEAESSSTATGEDYGRFELAFIPADKDFGVLEIPIVNDNKQEGDETIKLFLRNGGLDAPIGAQATATLTIKDDDSGMPMPTPTPVGMPMPTPTPVGMPMPTPTPVGMPMPTPTPVG